VEEQVEIAIAAVLPIVERALQSGCASGAAIRCNGVLARTARPRTTFREQLFEHARYLGAEVDLVE
jgi:hypothetical protein